MTDSFVSVADIAAPDPAGLALDLAAYWAGFDLEVETCGAKTVARLGIGSGEMEPTPTGLRFRLEAADLGKLEILRSTVTETLVAFLKDDALAVGWRGNMPTGRLFADFREVRLVRTVALGPRIRRLTFTGGDIARFGSGADIHVRMYFPPEGLATPEWPGPGEDGRTVWPAEDRRPDVRYYTVRRWRPDANEIDVDFVLHDDVGPGCAFAARAKPGAVCGMAGPVGRMAPHAAWTLLVGDETALPAIARTLEEMPRDARGAAFIEVNDGRDEIALAQPSGVAVRWLHRRGAPAGATTLLLDALASAPLPLVADPFVWAACEYSAAKAIRKHLRDKRGLARDRALVVGYWQREAKAAVAA